MIFIRVLTRRVFVSGLNRRFLSCDQKPGLAEINRNLLTINNNIAVVNYNTRICFYFSLINICVSVFC